MRRLVSTPKLLLILIKHSNLIQGLAVEINPYLTVIYRLRGEEYMNESDDYFDWDNECYTDTEVIAKAINDFTKAIELMKLNARGPEGLPEGPRCLF